MSIKEKAQKLTNHSETILGTKIPLNKSLELMAKVEGFNNSNTAMAHKGVFDLNKIENLAANMPEMKYVQKNRIDAGVLPEDQLMSFLSREDLVWKFITNKKHTKHHKINVKSLILEGRLFEVKLGSIDEYIDTNTNQVTHIGLVNKELLVLGFLTNPTNVSGMEEVLDSKSLNISLINKLKKYNIECLSLDEVSELTNQKDKINNSNMKGKKLYNFVIKELNKRDIKAVSTNILKEINLEEKLRFEFWNHVKKYKVNDLYIIGDCPNCGSSHDTSYEGSDGLWFTCDDCGCEFETMEMLDSTYYLSLKSN